VSRICQQLDEVVGAFRTRPLDHIGFPYVYLDATYLHVRTMPGKGGQVVSMAVVVATGIAADGSREVLGLDVGDSEDETFWRGFLLSLRPRPGRGAAGDLGPTFRAGEGVEAVLPGLLASTLPSPLRRNLLAHVPKSHADMVAAVFRTIFCSARPRRRQPGWEEVRVQLASSFRKVGPLMDDAKAEVLPSPRSRRRIGARSGRPTRSSGSTKRSSAGPASWGSSRTPPP
jgi:putative transposase